MDKKFHKLDNEGKDSILKLFRVRPQFVTHISPVTVEATHQNFFSGSKDLLDKIPDHEKGPRQDAKGNIVKYTVVGSVQSFVAEKSRSQQQNRKVGQIRVTSQATPSTQQQNDQTERGLFTQKGNVVNNLDQSSKDLGRKSKNRARDYQDIVLTEDQVQDYICKVQERMNTNKAENRKKTLLLQKNLSVGETLGMTKCQRVFEKFNQVQQKWDDLKNKAETTVTRPPGQTLIERAEQHRVKEEIKRLLDALTPIEEKQGNNFWVYGLRKQDSNIKPKTFVDLFEKNHQIYGNPKTPSIEIIRRSSLSQSDFKPFNTFTSQSALNKKLSENSDIIKKLVPTVPDDVGNLEIVGQNVLEQEIIQLKSGQQKSQFPYVRFSSNPDVEKYILKTAIKPEPSSEDEIIEENYNRRRLLSQGKLSQTKGYF